MEPTKIIKLYEMRESERRNLDGTFDLIRRFFVPFRSEFWRDNREENSVDWRSREVFDSTAVEAVDTLSASMQGALTSPSMEWFELKFRQDELNEDSEVQLWLQQVSKAMHEELQESNFNIEASEYYIDLVSYGTAILIEEADGDLGKWEGLDFKAVPLDKSYFDEDSKGNIINFYRRLEYNALQICDKFGDENVPQWVKEKRDGGHDDKISVIFCVYQRKDKKDADVSKVMAPTERPYGYKYIIRKDAFQLGATGGYYEMPGFVSRWRRTPGSVWGFSPAHVCLSDVLTLNTLTSDLLEAVGKAIDPTTLTTQRNLLSDLDLGRGGLTVVRNIEDLVPFESRARFDVGELKIDRLQDSIRRCFRVDQLQLKESPAMTATEVQVRYELMQRLLGPTFGRMKNDFLDPLLQRTFNIMYRAGILPPMPVIAEQMRGEIDIEYTGPLPRAQKSQTADSINMWIGSLAALAEALPEVLDIPDGDKIARGLARLHGVPADMAKGTAEVDKLRKERQQQQAEMMKLEQAQMAASAAKDGAAAATQMNGA